MSAGATDAPCDDDDTRDDLFRPDLIRRVALGTTIGNAGGLRVS